MSQASLARQASMADMTTSAARLCFHEVAANRCVRSSRAEICLPRSTISAANAILTARAFLLNGIAANFIAR